MDRHLFLSANTPDGFVHRFDSIVTMYGLKKLYILKGGSGIGKSTFIKNFADAFTEHPITYIHCSSDPKSLDGAVIEDIGIGIIDGTPPHAVDPKYPGITDEIINLGEFIIPGKVTAKRSEIDRLNAQKHAAYARAYKNLNQAREAHSRIEKLYADAVDFAAINALCNKLTTSVKLQAGVIRRN